MRICFLVDDDLDDQEIFTLALKDLDRGIAFVTANNSRQALCLLQESESFAPDFNFIDLNMPRINGKQCLAKIKKLPHLAQIPVIVYSTSTAPKDNTETKQLGAYGFISKPSNIRALTNILADIFIKYGMDSKTLV